LIVNIAFIYQHFATEHIVAGKSVAGKLETPERKLLALVDGNIKIRDAFIRICRTVLKRRRDFRGVLNKTLGTVGLLQVLVQSFAELLAVSYHTFLQANESANHLFRKYRIALNFHLADAIQLAVDDRNSNFQRVVHRRNERQWQDWKTGAFLAEALDTRLTVTRLKVTLRLHVVVDEVQVVIELLAIEDVKLLKARDQSRLFDILHLATQVAAFENLTAFEANLGHAHTLALVDDKIDGARSSRDFFDTGCNNSVWMALGRQQFLQNPLCVFQFNWIEERLF